jgi:beta-galactosidase
MNRPFAVLLVVCALVSIGWREVRSQPAPRVVSLLPLDSDWRFCRGDFANAAMPAFDDTSWRRVDLPHDWSAEGPFSAEYGSGNGYAPGGIAWYRKHFALAPEAAGKLVTIEFDGVYDHAEVWVNGQFAGGRPYGYASFECTLTPHVTFGSGDNVIAVRVDHSRFADSRWYTGSGIYRHVRLCVRDPLHIARWGTFVTTPVASARAAAVRIETAIENASGRSRSLTLESQIVSGGVVVATARTPTVMPAGGKRTLVQEITVREPQRWSLESPVRYVVRQQVHADSAIVDQGETSFGIRTIQFDSRLGFLLNEQPVRIKGVCLHHDGGSLGAAVPEGVWERRLRALKDLGVNAIRTSHNPPAPEFLDLCDRLGLLVEDEAFDEFTPPKNKWVNGWNAGVPSRFGYGEIFAEWSVTDIQDMVRRDRNHPSVILWSIGNEIDYPNDPFSHPVLGKSYRPENPPASDLVRYARPLVDAVRTLDSSRPVTAALASLAMSDAVALPQLLDVVGYNYQESRYGEDHKRYPQRVIVGSENNHQFANWAIVRDNPYVVGQFLWTGIDYLGEARAFPNRASGAGLLDLCGFRKPAAWFRQSLWSDAPMVYLAVSPAGNSRTRGARVEEHWNWPTGSTVTVSCYTNCEEVTLTLNHKPLAARRLADAVDGVLSWDVPYAPGMMKGKAVAAFALVTADTAARIELLPYSTAASPGGREVSQVEFRIVDAAGTRQPTADAVVTFEVEGPAHVLGIGNGDLNSVEDCKNLVHRAYQGRGLAILEATGAAGTITLKASSPGLEPARLTIPVGAASLRIARPTPNPAHPGA